MEMCDTVSDSMQIGIIRNMSNVYTKGKKEVVVDSYP